MMPVFAEILAEKAAALGIVLLHEQLEAYTLYFENLIDTNKQINLTAITEVEEVAIKHFIDSLTVYDNKYFPEKAEVCDVGTGAGFPGLVLKIFRPSLKVVLLDALAKRLTFLEKQIRLLNLGGISTCHSRAEDAGRSTAQRARYDVVVARAVAPLNVLGEYCMPLVKPGGVFIAMKARQARQEIKEADNAIGTLGGNISEVKAISLPNGDERMIIYCRKISPTPTTYPRQAGTPTRKPLA